MSILNPEVKNLWSTVNELGLWDENTNIDFETFNALIEEDDNKLKELLSQCEDTEYIRNLTLDELVRLPFDAAKNTIDSFSMEKRINILNELETKKTYYYNQTARYCGVSKDELISAKEFRSLLSKIKHMEILQNWLYGIA